VDACNDRLVAEIEHVNPRVIVILGGTAIRAVIGPDEKRGIKELRGQRLWSDRFHCFVLPTYHPVAVLRMPSLFSDFGRDMQKIETLLKLPLEAPKTAPPRFEVVETYERAMQFCEFLSWQSYVSCDIETDYVERGCNLISVGFSWADGVAVILPRRLFNIPGVLAALQKVVDLPTLHLIFHNGKFDVEHMAISLGLRVRVDEDTLLMHYCIDEREGTHGLKALAREYLDAPDWEADIRKYLPKRSLPFSTIPETVLFQYQSYDCDYTRKLFHLFQKMLEEEGTERPYRTILIPASEAFTHIENHGIRIDRAYITQLRDEMGPKIQALGDELHDMAMDLGLEPSRIPGGKLNPNSPMQLQIVIYDLLHCPPFAGSRTTSIDALAAYRERHPFIGKLLEYRQVQKLYSTYVTGFLDKLDVNDHVHPDYMLFGTVTGRLSARNPPMQTIPRKSIFSIKRMFIAEPEHVFFEADYSQLELRVAAHITQEPALLDAFTNGLDIHRRTAADVFHKAYADVTDDERYIAKLTVFGILYGRGAYSLATGEMNCGVEEAQAYIDAFFKRMPKLRAWTYEIADRAIQDGYVQSLFGRKRRFPFVHPDTIAEIQRQAVNTPIQSPASDICLLALIRLHNELTARKWGYVHFSVHDSIAGSVRADVQTEAIALVRSIMETPPFESNVPFKVDIKVGPNWEETTSTK